MLKKAIKSLPVLISLVLIVSCTSSRYYPNTPDIPSYKQKGDVYLTGGLSPIGADAQFSCAISNHLALSMNASYRHAVNYTIDEIDDTLSVFRLFFFPLLLFNYDSERASQIYADMSVNYFHPLGRNLIADYKIGYGEGTNYTNIDNNYLVDMNKLFVYFGMRTNWQKFNIGLGSKLSLVFQKDNYWSRPDYDNHFWALEPFAGISIGSPEYKQFYIRLVETIPFGSLDPTTQLTPDLFFSLGVVTSLAKK